MQNKKVLIVEDNELNLKLFKDILSAHDIASVETRDGRDALAIAEREKPDLIIMDIQLPHISGIDIIKDLKKDTKLRMIPIVAVTAFALQADKEAILATGCESYLSKPIAIKEFVDVLSEYLA